LLNLLQCPEIKFGTKTEVVSSFQ